MRPLSLLLVVVMSLVLALFGERPGYAAEEYNLAGSAQLDYHLVENGPRSVGAPSATSTFQGFTMEAALKVAVDISDHLSANVKACYGCHGVEIDMAYFDYRPFDELNVRVGRFSPSFGAFNVRHDPANHMLSDKPLPYDMGRMLRRGDWNNGVLPSPFPSNGLEIGGSHWFGARAQLDYAAYAVTGFKNDTDPNPVDFNFQESHLPYYIDNALRPAFGARAALTWKANPTIDVTLGASTMFGTYDPRERFNYLIAGTDLSVRVQRTAFRAEYLLRRQQFDTSNPDIFKYAVPAEGGDFFVKQGGFLEVEQPLTSALNCSGRVDGLHWDGNVSNVPAGSAASFATAVSPLRKHASVTRETIGLAYAIERNFRLKGSIELWNFTYPDALGRTATLGFHFAAVGSF
jgi:hypothetical protein